MQDALNQWSAPLRLLQPLSMTLLIHPTPRGPSSQPRAFPQLKQCRCMSSVGGHQPILAVVTRGVPNHRFWT